MARKKNGPKNEDRLTGKALYSALCYFQKKLKFNWDDVAGLLNLPDLTVQEWIKRKYIPYNKNFPFFLSG